MNQQNKPSEETKRRWNQDANNWIWGLFYYNKEDKRIFPPKRIAWMGWTINFANPISVSAFLIVFLLILALLSLKQTTTTLP